MTDTVVVSAVAVAAVVFCLYVATRRAAPAKGAGGVSSGADWIRAAWRALPVADRIATDEVLTGAFSAGSFARSQVVLRPSSRFFEALSDTDAMTARYMAPIRRAGGAHEATFACMTRGIVDRAIRAPNGDTVWVLSKSLGASPAEHAPRLRDFLLHVKLLHAVSAGARGRVRAAAATGDQDTGEVAFQAGVSEAGRVNLYEPPPRKASSWVVLEAAAHSAVGTEESVAPDTIPSDEIYRTLIAQEK